MLCNSFTAESSGGGPGVGACGTPENPGSVASCPDCPNKPGEATACEDGAGCTLNGVANENDGALAAVAPLNNAGVCAGCEGGAKAKLGAEAAPKTLEDGIGVLAIVEPNKEADDAAVNDGALDAPKAGGALVEVVSACTRTRGWEKTGKPST